MSKPLPHKECHLRGVVLEISAGMSMLDHLRRDREDQKEIEVANKDLDHVEEHLQVAIAEYHKAARTVQRASTFLRLAMHTMDMPEKKRGRLLYRAVRMLEKIQ